jgi:hypothetical protein
MIMRIEEEFEARARAARKSMEEAMAEEVDERVAEKYLPLDTRAYTSGFLVLPMHRTNIPHLSQKILL